MGLVLLTQFKRKGPTVNFTKNIRGKELRVCLSHLAGDSHPVKLCHSPLTIIIIILIFILHLIIVIPTSQDIRTLSKRATP